MSEARSRKAQKLHTREQILDAALQLSSQGTLAALSLRQVAKEVGIVPTAFYRHFDSLDALGLELVDRAFAALRDLLREARVRNTDVSTIIEQSVDVLAEFIPSHGAQFTFIARERFAGPQSVRTAIWHQIELVERELATDLVRIPVARDWSNDDLAVVAHLIVAMMIETTQEMVAFGDQPSRRDAATERARKQLHMLITGLAQWRSQT